MPPRTSDAMAVRRIFNQAYIITQISIKIQNGKKMQINWINLATTPPTPTTILSYHLFWIEAKLDGWVNALDNRHRLLFVRCKQKCIRSSLVIFSRFSFWFDADGGSWCHCLKTYFAGGCRPSTFQCEFIDSIWASESRSLQLHNAHGCPLSYPFTWFFTFRLRVLIFHQFSQSVRYVIDRTSFNDISYFLRSRARLLAWKLNKAVAEFEFEPQDRLLTIFEYTMFDSHVINQVESDAHELQTKK